MASNYKHLSAFIKITPDTNKDAMLEEYQEYVNEQFYNATDVFTIQEYTNGGLVPIDVRLNTIYGETGSKLSDDFRKVIFKDLNHARTLGQKYFFDDSWWITINYDLYGKPTASVVIHKCRNVLKWINQNNGAILTEPCVFKEYISSSPTPLFNKNIILPNGTMVVVVQNNEQTKTIGYNQRFYFGDYCYKVTNMSIPLNNPTNNVAPLIYFTVSLVPSNEYTDDIELGIANINDYNYQITILDIDSTFSQLVGYKTLLNYQVQFNGKIVSRDILWTSNNENVVKVDNGEIELLSLGMATIRASLLGNSNVYDDIVINVVSELPTDYNIEINPLPSYVLEGDSTIIEVYGISNGEDTSHTFTMTTDNVPDNYYATEILSGNSFKISNLKRYLNNPLEITFKDDTNDEERIIQVWLKGVF